MKNDYYDTTLQLDRNKLMPQSLKLLDYLCCLCDMPLSIETTLAIKIECFILQIIKLIQIVMERHCH